MDSFVFDNFEEDGQLSMFDMAEDLENLTIREDDFEDEETAEGKQERTAKKPAETVGGETPERTVKIRIQNCSCCGRILWVKDETNAYTAHCMNCNVGYIQSK